MVFELRQPANKLVLLGFLFLSALYIPLVSIHYLAAFSAATPDELHLRRAARLEPWNAEYPYRIGEYALLVKQSPEEAVSFFSSAVQINPRHAQYWVAVVNGTTANPWSHTDAVTAPHTPALVHALSCAHVTTRRSIANVGRSWRTASRTFGARSVASTDRS